MCGIAGVVYFNETRAEASVIKRMTDAMAHRGPNAEGIYTEGPVALGHRRLSILDVSDASNQPFSDASGNFQMVFNGELYNYQTVRDSLKNVSFRTTGDTEVLIESFRNEGVSCIHHFSGMFAFAVWDRSKQELVLVRDRMGVKPLYYYISEHFCIFASEVRAILASGLVSPKINQFAIAEFLSYQSIGAPDTIIEGIYQLEAGHYMRIQNGSMETQCYWDITEGHSGNDYSSKERIHQNLHFLLQDAVQSRLVSDVPVGAFLSGGIDSSAVVALMASASPASPNTFTISFSEKEFDESQHAATVAKMYHTNHHEILLQPTVMLDELTGALNAMDTPSGDGINTYVVSQAVKKAGITVALSGIGGDELFGGYPFFPQYKYISKHRRVWDGIAGLRKLAGYGFTHSGNRRMVRLGELLSSTSSKIEHVYPVFRQIFSAQQLSEIIHAEFLGEMNIEKYLKQHAVRLSQFEPYGQISIAEFAGYTQHTLLKDTDQMGMAHALEIREPLFDHKLVEYVLGIPDHFKIGKYPKSLFVEALGNMLPPSIVHRPKQGFVFPWQLWLKGPLREFCNHRIRNISNRGIVNGSHLSLKWERFLKNDPQVKWMELWLFVVLEYWLERNIDRLNK